MSELKKQIIALSVSSNWDDAKQEWDLDSVYKVDTPKICLCGHRPIIEICVLKNKYNQAKTTVGNVCVKKFLGLPSDAIFRSVKRIIDDCHRSLNVDAIVYTYSKGWINEWEYQFLTDTIRKRNLSDKQLSKRISINKMVISKITKPDKSLFD